MPKELDPKPLFDQMAKLQKAKSDLEEKLKSEEVSMVTTKEEPVDLKDYESFAASMSMLLAKESDPVVKSLVTQKVVERILVHTEGIEIHFYMGQNYFRRELDNSGSRPFFMSKNKKTTSDSTEAAIIEFKKKKRGPSERLEDCSSKNQLYFLKVQSSNSLTNGDSGKDSLGPFWPSPCGHACGVCKNAIMAFL